MFAATGTMSSDERDPIDFFKRLTTRICPSNGWQQSVAPLAECGQAGRLVPKARQVAAAFRSRPHMSEQGQDRLR
jgi:hypothetical protein